MNTMMMMAMAVAMSRRSNSSSTVQTILGASDSLGQSGRLAVGILRQRTDEQERAAADKKVGQELLALLDAHKIPVEELAKYPSLQRVATTAGVVVATTPTTAAGAMQPHSHVIGTVAPTSTALVQFTGGTGGDAKYVMAERAGTFDGLARITAAADVAVERAQLEVAEAQAKVEKAEADAKLAQQAAEKADAEAKANAGDAARQERAVEAKKKAEEAEGHAEKTRVHLHRLTAIATAMRSAADQLRTELAEVC